MKLTNRELEILQFIIQTDGRLTYNGVADHFFITHHTVKAHIGRINDKLGTNCLLAATLVALRKGWVTL